MDQSPLRNLVGHTHFGSVSKKDCLLDASRDCLLRGVQAARFHPMKGFNYSEQVIIKVLPNDGYHNYAPRRYEHIRPCQGQTKRDK